MKIFLLLLVLPLMSVRAQTDDSWKLYDDSTLARVDITIAPARLQWMYANVRSDSEHAATIRFRNTWVDETVESVGFRLRGNSSRDSKKKSFKVSFNTFTSGGRFHGLKGLNFNGEHNDPSVVRSKLCFDLFHDAGIPAPRANHVRLFINGAYYGLYISVEHIDDEFIAKNYADDSGNLWKCLYPADLKYLGTAAAPYKAIMNNYNTQTPAYELKMNETAGDFSAFVKFVDVVNNTPLTSLADSADKYIEVHRVLEYFAINTLVGQWDGYRSNMNNYYLYHLPSENKVTIIPYDYDNTFGADWFNKTWATADPYTYPKATTGARPLSERLLAVDRYRDLFTHMLRFYRDNLFTLSLWEGRIDSIRSRITAAASEDTYRTLDYGFTMTDFLNSYSAGSYQKLHIKNGLKQFVNLRNASITAQLNEKNAPAAAYVVSHAPNHPAPADSVVVTASCYGVAGVQQVQLIYLPSLSLPGIIYEMKRDPIAGSKHVEDADRWTGTIPPNHLGTRSAYKVSVIDSLGRRQDYPSLGFLPTTTTVPGGHSVVINEFLADNSTIADPAGECDDYLELYNPTSSPVTLTNMYLTDSPGALTKWKFTQPDLVLEPGAFLLVWCDEGGSQPGVHTNFKLSAGGEFLALTMADGVSVLDSVSFGPQKKDVSLARSPNGSGAWVFQEPTPGAPNRLVAGVETNGTLPLRFSVSAFPNPFNPSTTLQYTMPEAGDVTVTIFDVLGREVWGMPPVHRTAGTYTVQWNGSDAHGMHAGSGVYLLRITAGAWTSSVKLLMVK